MSTPRKKKKQQRGASVTQSRIPRKSFSIPAIYPALIAAVLILAATGIYNGVDVLLSKPVTRVAVTGEFRFVDREVIAKQVEPFLNEGFIRLNLQSIRDELKTRSWVYDVTISRLWPDQISINVVEQKPIARWAQVGYLNHRGELFKPELIVKMDELPLLSGPEGSAERVMTNFQQFGDALLQQGLTLQALSLDERENWIATLDNQASIVLGNTQVMEKMRRFAKTYKAVLSKDIDKIKRIDMRYNNGLAVAWKTGNLKSKRT
jgi:cell division protein FtsQ